MPVELHRRGLVDRLLMSGDANDGGGRTAYLACKAGLDAVVLAIDDSDLRGWRLVKARSREVPAALKAVLVDQPTGGSSS